MFRRVVAAAASIVLAAAAPRPGAADQSKPIVAVFEIEARSVVLSQDALANLTSYIASKLSESGEYEVVPQDRLKEALTAKKKDSLKQCYQQSCQIEIGQELAANKAVATQVMKVGSRCVVTCNIYDLRKATSAKAATAKGTCDEDGISSAIDEVLQKLSVKTPPRPPAAAHSQPGPPPPAPGAPAAAAPPREAWGPGGAAVGLVAAAVALGLTGGAEGTLCFTDSCDRWASVGLGAAALVTMLVSGPITAAAGSSERAGGARGLVGLRIAGWVLYGTVAAEGLAMVVLGAADVEFPHGPVIASGVLGAGSLVLFAIDALASRSEARRLRAGRSGREPSPRLVLMPFATHARLQDGTGAGMLGVWGAF